METALSFIPMTLLFLGCAAVQILAKYALHFYKRRGKASFEPITNLAMGGFLVYMVKSQASHIVAYLFLFLSVMIGFVAAHTDPVKSPKRNNDEGQLQDGETQ
jgi:hypothetical protein